jgi:hypothetical protein
VDKHDRHDFERFGFRFCMDIVYFNAVNRGYVMFEVVQNFFLLFPFEFVYPIPIKRVLYNNSLNCIVA